jgi:integrase
VASLRRKERSPFWFACYLGADGRRLQVSTKQSNRKKAQAVADAWERAAKLGAEKRLGEAQARRILSEIYEVVNNEPLPSSSTRDFLDNWVEKRKLDTAPRTQKAYAQIVRDFLVSLGERATRDISQVSKADVAKYRDAVLLRTSKASANKVLKYLRVALGAAYKDGLCQDNPAAKLDTIKRTDEERKQRRPFTLPELKLVLEHASGEWKGLILFGLYTGQRLGDIARLCWTNVDLQREEIRFVTRKTGRSMIIPLHPVLIEYLESLEASDDPDLPVFPKSAPIAGVASGDSRLSQQFHTLLVSAGLAQARSKDATGEGRSKRRNISEVSFHSLRHTATSLLKNAGVSETVAMDIIGHDSKAMSRHYTVVDEPTKRKALSQLPRFTP